MRGEGSLAARLERRFARLMDRAPDGILVVDREDATLYRANLAFGALAGIGVAPFDLEVQVEGSPPLRDFVHPPHYARIETVLASMVEGDEAAHTMEADLIHQADGERVACEWTFHPPDPASRVAIVFVRDVRPRVAAQRRIDDYATMLEAKNRELASTQEQLVHQGKMAALGELVAGVVHELNTPLGGLTANAALVDKLGKKLGAPTAAPDGRSIAALVEAARTMARAAERIDDVLRSLRGFARLDAAEVGSVDLSEGLDAAVKLVASRHPGIAFETHLAALPPLECRAADLHQVFHELLTNAAEAIGEDGNIRVACREVAGGLEFEVRDDGAGIAPAHRPRLFDPGFTTKGVGVGTGLGLSSADRIVRAHRGRIDVDTAEGVGTTMRVTLPHASPPSRNMAPRLPDLRLVDVHRGVSAVLAGGFDTGLLQQLVEAPGSAQDLADAAGLAPRAVELSLEVLVEAGYAERAERGYRPTATLELMASGWAIRQGGGPWEHVEAFLRTGKSVHLAQGSGGPEREANYAPVVDMLARMFDGAAKSFAERVPLAPGARVLEVGCGSGVWGLAWLERHPKVRYTGLDFPQVLERMRGRAERLGVTDRVTSLPGDMHSITLPIGGYEAILLANVVHLEPIEKLPALFARLRPALAEGGELVIVDAVHDGSDAALARAVYGLHLEMRVAGACAHRAAALRQALREAGYESARLVTLTAESASLGALCAR